VVQLIREEHSSSRLCPWFFIGIGQAYVYLQNPQLLKTSLRHGVEAGCDNKCRYFPWFVFPLFNGATDGGAEINVWSDTSVETDGPRVSNLHQSPKCIDEKQKKKKKKGPRVL
jgi:hypothetical protein